MSYLQKKLGQHIGPKGPEVFLLALVYVVYPWESAASYFSVRLSLLKGN
jgi:hypothetical protein